MPLSFYEGRIQRGGSCCGSLDSCRWGAEGLASQLRRFGSVSEVTRSNLCRVCSCNRFRGLEFLISLGVTGTSLLLPPATRFGLVSTVLVCLLICWVEARRGCDRFMLYCQACWRILPSPLSRAAWCHSCMHWPGWPLSNSVATLSATIVGSSRCGKPQSCCG